MCVKTRKKRGKRGSVPEAHLGAVCEAFGGLRGWVAVRKEGAWGCAFVVVTDVTHMRLSTRVVQKIDTSNTDDDAGRSNTSTSVIAPNNKRD